MNVVIAGLPPSGAGRDPQHHDDAGLVPSPTRSSSGVVAGATQVQGTMNCLWLAVRQREPRSRSIPTCSSRSLRVRERGPAGIADADRGTSSHAALNLTPDADHPYVGRRNAFAHNGGMQCRRRRRGKPVDVSEHIERRSSAMLSRVLSSELSGRGTGTTRAARPGSRSTYALADAGRRARQELEPALPL